MAVLASFAFTATTADAKPRKRHHVERQKPRKSAEPTTTSDSDGTRWRYGSSAIIVDANTGKVLYEQNADSLRHPASVTKVMTLYLLFEQLDTGKLKLSSDLSVSAHAAAQSPTKLDLRPGGSIEVEDAIKAVITRSANDVAVVIAEAIGGSESDFAQLMTAKAHALGMSRTTFRNASGLPNPGQVTTARDLATLGRAIQERFPKYYRYFATRTFRYKGEAIGNHNRLLGRIEGVDGIKTGYTRASGFNLLTSVHRDDRYLIGVVMGGSSGRSRDDRMADLISDYLPKAYAGRSTAPKLVETASAAPLPDDKPRVATISALPEARPDVLAFAAPLPPRVDRAAAEVDMKTKMVVALLAKPIAEVPAEKVAAQISEPTVTASIQTALPKGAKDTARAAPKPAAQAQVTAAPVQVAPVQVAAVQATDASTVAAGSAAPIKPTGVKTVAIQRPVAQAALTSSLAPPTSALGYAGTKDTSRLVPTSSASAAIARKVAAAHPAPDEPSAEELARYEASVWPVFDDEELAAGRARAAQDAKPIRTASLGPTPVPKSVEKPASSKPSSARSGWVIQIGAYDEESAARAKLDLARSKAKSVLSGADPYTEKVMKGSTALYRARFAGFDEKDAKKACRLLQRNDFACMTLRN